MSTLSNNVPVLLIMQLPYGAAAPSRYVIIPKRISSNRASALAQRAADDVCADERFIPTHERVIAEVRARLGTDALVVEYQTITLPTERQLEPVY